MPVVLLLAGALAVALGLLPPAAALGVLERTAPVLGFLVAITVVAELGDRAGLFDVAARRAAALGGGSTRRLFLLTCALATGTTAVFSLDTTAVLLTPVVLAMAAALELPALPFAMATLWLANTASLLLPVSNLTNLLADQRLGLGAVAFAARTWPAQLAVLAVTLTVLLVRHRHALRGRYHLPPPAPVADRVLLAAATVVAAAIGPALLLGAPPWVAAAVAAVVLVVAFALRRPLVVSPVALTRLLPWRLVATTTGLFLLVAVAQEHGLPGLLGALAGTAGTGPADLARLAGVSALSANAVNNLPAYLALEPVAGGVDRLLAVLVGVDTGPLITVWASVATLLWRDRCAAAGLSVSARRIAAEGLLLAPAAVLTGALVLAMT